MAQVKKTTSERSSTKKTTAQKTPSKRSTIKKISTPKKRVQTRKLPNKKNKIVLNAMQTSILCVVVVVACFMIIIFNSFRDVKNVAVEQEVTKSKPSKNSIEEKDTQSLIEERALEIAKDMQQEKTAEKKQIEQTSTIEKEAPKVAKESKAKTTNKETASTKQEKQVTAQDKQQQKAQDLQQKANTTVAKKEAEKPLQAQKSMQVAKVIPPSTKPTVTPDTSQDTFPSIPYATNNAKLVFVFDDGGQNLTHLEKFTSLPFPITVAVLPKLQYSKAAADKVRASGHEVMLHQPMQAINLKVNPGPGAITPEMKISEIAKLVSENIAEVGPIVGINNHEGSLISEDEIKIGTVMSVAKEHNAFFLDSRTTSQTRVPQASMELGIPYYARNVFIDNEQDRDNIIKEIMRGINIANGAGAAILIGHIWSANILPNILIELYPVLKTKGYSFTTVSKSGAIINP